MSGNKVASRKWVEEQIGNLSVIDASDKEKPILFLIGKLTHNL